MLWVHDVASRTGSSNEERDRQFEVQYRWWIDYWVQASHVQEGMQLVSVVVDRLAGEAVLYTASSYLDSRCYIQYCIRFSTVCTVQCSILYSI